MRSQTKGYLTVFLSLSITIILSLIMALFYGARMGAVKMKTECVADIAMNSVLSEYSRELFSQYGLLMVDTSYGTGNHSILNTQEHLKYYAKKNFEINAYGKVLGSGEVAPMFLKEANITGSSFALDNNASVLRRQILEYMGSEPLEGLLVDTQENARIIEENELDSTDVEEMAGEVQDEIDEIELPIVLNEDNEEEEVSLGNPADLVNSQKSIGILTLSIPDSSQISGAAADLSRYASHRQLNRGTGLYDTCETSVTEKLLLEQYFYEKCSRYGEEMEKSLLKYQLEYMIFGEDSDYANLEKMARYLLFVREASNMQYLFSCEAKVKEAELAASLLTAVIMVPELKDLVKLSILFAWTFAESISDLNILFSGGRVPLLKSDETWRLSFAQMLLFRSFLTGGDLGEGLYYGDYLRARLFMTDTDTKLMRLADIIEMDVRKAEMTESFMLDHCLDIFRAEIEVTTSYGCRAKIERIYGYDQY